MAQRKAPVYAILAALIALTGALPGLAYSSYTPPWYDRVDPGGIPLDYISGLSTGDGVVYALGTYYDTSTNTYNMSVTVHSASTGEVQYYSLFYSSAGYDTLGNELLYGPDGFLYVVGTIAINSTHWVGMVLKLNPSDLSIVSSYYLDETGDGFKTALYGLCMDPRGSIYAVGRQIYNGNGTHYGVVLAMDSQLNPFYRTRLSLAQYNYNFTLYSCTYLDGNIHAIGNVLWYSNSTGYNYITYASIVTFSSNMTVINEKYIPVYSPNYYVYVEYKNDISTDGINLYIAFTYMDSSDTSAGSIMILDSALNEIQRINFSSANWERLGEISTASDGSYVVAGETSDDYGTGLGTTYMHGIVLVLDSTNRVRKAVIYGASDNGSLATITTINGTGYIFSGGAIYSDNLSFYDVTQEVTSVIQSGAQPTRGVYTGEAIVIPKEYLYEVGELSLETIVTGAPSNPSIAVNWRPMGTGLEVTPSGASSALVVAYDVALAPPPPIPEKGLYVALAITLVTAVMLARRFFRYHSS